MPPFVARSAWVGMAPPVDELRGQVAPGEGGPDNQPRAQAAPAPLQLRASQLWTGRRLGHCRRLPAADEALERGLGIQLWQAEVHRLRDGFSAALTAKRSGERLRNGH